MNDLFLYIIIAILFIALLVGIVILLTIIFNKKDDYHDNAILLNFCSALSNGKFLGEVLKTQNGKNNRKIIEFLPKDVDLKNIAELKPEKVIVDNAKIISLSKGLVSSDKNILISLPPSADDFSGPIKETLIGKALMWATELQNFTKTQSEILQEGIDRRDAIAKEYGTGEMSTKFLEFTNSLVQDYMQSTLTKDNKKSSVFPTNSSLGGSSHE